MVSYLYIQYNNLSIGIIVIVILLYIISLLLTIVCLVFCWNTFGYIWIHLEYARPLESVTDHDFWRFFLHCLTTAPTISVKNIWLGHSQPFSSRHRPVRSYDGEKDPSALSALKSTKLCTQKIRRRSNSSQVLLTQSWKDSETMVENAKGKRQTGPECLSICLASLSCICLNLYAFCDRAWLRPGFCFTAGWQLQRCGSSKLRFLFHSSKLLGMVEKVGLWWWICCFICFILFCKVCFTTY